MSHQIIMSQNRKSCDIESHLQHSPMMRCHMEGLSPQTHEAPALLHIRPHKGLGQDICCHVFSGNKHRLDNPRVHSIPQPKPPKVHMLHPPMVFRILGHRNGWLVVHEEDRGGGRGVAKLPHELAHPVEDSCVNQSCGCGNFSDSI